MQNRRSQVMYGPGIGGLFLLANSELNEVIYHNKPLDEAIRIIQDKVQAVLDTEHGEQMELD